MTETTEIQLKKLLQNLKQDSKNIDLINSIAIGYFENPSMLDENEDFVLRVLEYEIEIFRKQYFNYTAHVDLRFVEVLAKTQSTIIEAKIVRSLIQRLAVNLLSYKKIR